MRTAALLLQRAWRAFIPDWAGRNLKLVLAARVGMSVGRSLAAVVTALYLADIGFTAVEIGTLFVVVTIVSAGLSTAIGLLADRWGRRVFLIGVPLLTAAAATTYAFSHIAAILFVAGAAGSFGRGAGAGGGSVGPYRPAESALVAESVESAHRPAAFSRIAFTSAAGALLGGLAAQLVHLHPHMSAGQVMDAFRPAFLLSAALAACAGILACWIREPAHAAPRRKRSAFSWPRRSWPALWRFWVTNGVNGFGMGLFGPFVSYWFFRRYGAGPGQIGVLFALVNLASLVSILTAARLAGRFGTIRTIVAVRIVAGIMILPMVFAPSFRLAGAVYLVRMMIQRIVMPLRQSFTQDLADPAERAGLAALSTLPAQGTMAAGQAGAGFLFDQVSLAAPFTITAFIQLANAALYGILFLWRPPRVRPEGDVHRSRVGRGRAR